MTSALFSRRWSTAAALAAPWGGGGAASEDAVAEPGAPDADPGAGVADPGAAVTDPGAAEADPTAADADPDAADARDAEASGTTSISAAGSAASSAASATLTGPLARKVADEGAALARAAPHHAEARATEVVGHGHRRHRRHSRALGGERRIVDLLVAAEMVLSADPAGRQVDPVAGLQVRVAGDPRGLGVARRQMVMSGEPGRGSDRRWITERHLDRRALDRDDGGQHVACHGPGEGHQRVALDRRRALIDDEQRRGVQRPAGGVSKRHRRPHRRHHR